MNRKIRFVWEAKNIDGYKEEMKLSASFNESPLYCGMFDREVSIYNVNIKYIHFTDFRISDDVMTIQTDDNLYSLNLRCYENLVFKIIEPGITFLKVSFHFINILY